MSKEKQDTGELDIDEIIAGINSGEEQKKGTKQKKQKKQTSKKKEKPIESYADKMKMSDISVDTENRKATEKEVNALAQSIKELGLLIPVMVDGNGILVDGERRYRAAEKLGWEEIPAVKVDKEKQSEIDPVQYSLNCIRENFSAKQQKDIFQLYKDQGKTQQEIADMFGVTQGRVSQVLNPGNKKSDGKKEKPAPVVTSFEPAEGMKVQVKENSVLFTFEISNADFNGSYDDIKKCICKTFKEGTSGLKKEVEEIRKNISG